MKINNYLIIIYLSFHFILVIVQVLPDSMGAFFDQIRHKKINVDKSLLNASGSKLRQYFCSFRSICEDFTIRAREYMQIFGSNVKSFEVWDPNRTGIIDAIEMFSGLIIFSKIAYQDKIRFLYEIFDLNEQGFLEYDELAYLFINICEATYKVYQIESHTLNSQIIEQYLDQFFSEETQLKYEDFLRWSYRTEEIIQFFQVIGHPFQPQTNSHSIDDCDEANLQSKRVQVFGYKKENQLKVKIDERFLNIIKNDHILLQDEQKQQEFNPVMKWVYGIRVDDIKYPLHYRKTQYYKAANEKFIYICGKNVVVLYPKLNTQNNYTRHSKPVSCVEVASCDQVVASGEMGLYPSIHIWHLKTAKCIQKFDKVHKNSIKLLKFLRGDELLITVGQKHNSSLVILNINTRQKILSTYLLEPVLNVIEVKPESMNESEFCIVLPSYVVKCTTCNNMGYNIKYNKVVQPSPADKQRQLKVKLGSALTINGRGVLAIVDEGNNLHVYDHTTNLLHLVSLPSQELEQKQEGQKNKIIDVYSSKQSNKMYILYPKCFTLVQLDAKFRIVHRNRVANFPAGLFNLELVQLIQIHPNCVIILSLMGDVIKVTNFRSQIRLNRQNSRCPRSSQQKVLESIQILPEPNDQNELQDQGDEKQELPIQFHKYCQIFKMEKINGICFLSKQAYEIASQLEKSKLVVASNSLIYIIDQVERQLLSLQCLEQNITHIHSVANTYAVATQLKYLMILRDGVTVEKTKCIDSTHRPDGVINGFKITGESLIVAIDQQIYIYCKSNGNYLDRESKRIKIDHGIPIHLSMTSIPKVFLVITKQKTILRLNSESKEKNLLTAKELNCDFLQTYYPQINSIRSPILFSGTKKIFLLAQPNGDIYYWNSLNHLIKSQPFYSLLTGHSSAVSELVFSDSGFISSGAEDGQIIIWRNHEMIYEVEQQENRAQQHVSYIDKTKPKVKFPDQGTTQLTKVREQQNNLKLISQCYMDELIMLDKFTCDKLPLKDSQIEVIVKDGDLYRDIAKSINHILLPNNSEVFEPMLEKKKKRLPDMELGKKKSRKNMKLPQKICLNMVDCFVYGFNSEKTRQSLFYIHYYHQKKQSVILPWTKVASGNQKQKQIEFSRELLLPLNETHKNCKRSFFYFTGRVGLIWSPILKTQFQYDFHINRITCAAVHPSKSIVCTAQISNSCPVVHVWNMETVTLVHDFKTRHNRFINKIDFSRDGDLIVSLGGPPFQQSIQIYNWVREQVICFRCMDDSCFYDIKFNPYDSSQVAVCGVKSLCIMKVSNRTLIRKQAAVVQSNQEITCMVYTSSIYGNTIESDIITGNSNGDISLFICGKYVICKKQAHEKSINCLKICELFKYKTIVISAAEDNLIKFWDTKFNQIACLNVKEALNLNKSFHESIKISIAPQSIDLYQCLEDKDCFKLEQQQNKAERIDSQAILLVGTRNGSIFQVKISNQYQGLKLFISENNDTEKEDKIEKDLGDFLSMSRQTEKPLNSENKGKMGEKLQLNYVNHFHNLPSTFGRSAMFDIKGNLMITYSKIAQFFTLWSIEKRQMIRMHKLNNYPSCIKFSKTNFVALCYLDGRVQFLEIDASFQFLPREEKIFFDWDYQPINIVFADNDSKVAVVFLREQQQKRLSSNANPSIMEENSPSEGEQVLMIYQRVFSQNNAPFNSTDKNTHCISTERRKFKNIFWCDFSAGGSKILICYTLNYYLKLNNSNRKRMMSTFQTNRYQPLYEYILYDIGRRMEKDLTNEEFNVLNFSPAVRAKYHYYGDCKVVQEYNQQVGQYEQSEGENKKKANNNSLSNKLARTMSKNPQLISDIAHSSRLAPSELVVNSALANEVTEQFVPICQMAQFQKLTLMGTVYGEVLAISSENFYFDSAEQLSESQQKCVKAKCFALFDSPISAMQVVGNKLYISAKDCGTIAEYILKTDQFQTSNEIEWRGEQADKSQLYYQFFTIEKIENWLKYVFPKRKNFYETKLNCQERNSQKNTDISNCDSLPKDQLLLQPYRIIGRNAFYKRNNVLIDLKENLITFSGCNLLILSGHPQNGYRYEQQFLKLDKSIFSVNPQISAITLSEDKRILFAGTTQQNCQVIMWDISTRTELQHICFKGYVSILLIKVSEKQKHAVVLALSKNAEQVLYFISLESFEILASFCVSDSTYICDLAFVPGNQFKFIACGVNYMTEWVFKGGLLNCQSYSMRKSQDSAELGRKSDIFSVTFYSIIFLKDIAITSGSDGYLYLWNDKTLIKKQNANPKAAILTLFAAKNSKIFASGAVDGKANIWQLGLSSIIQKVYQFSIYSGKEAIIPSKFHIQSVNIGTNEIFIGTRSGEIHRYEFISNEASQFEENYNKQNHSLILSSFDNDRVNSCSFNISSQKLYVLTQSGIFSVFNLVNNEKIKEEKIKVDNQEIVKMLVCKLSCKIYIIMKKGIDVYTYIEEGKYSNRFNKEKEVLRSGNTEIKAGILSLNEKYLALLMSPNHLQNAKIELYDMSQHDGKQFYAQYKVLENIPANIEIIDFSTDNGYLVYKNSDQDETIIDLTTKSQIYPKEIEFELEWNEEAKKTSKYIRDICSTYSDENKLKSIIQIMNHSVITTDEMGSLRVFRYDQNFEDNLIEYYRIYLEHLSNIYLCIISADCTLLVTVGWEDRSIILWRVKNFDLNNAKNNQIKKKSKAVN